MTIIFPLLFIYLILVQQPTPMLLSVQKQYALWDMFGNITSGDNQYYFWSAATQAADLQRGDVTTKQWWNEMLSPGPPRRC